MGQKAKITCVSKQDKYGWQATFLEYPFIICWGKTRQEAIRKAIKEVRNVILAERQTCRMPDHKLDRLRCEPIEIDLDDENPPLMPEDKVKELVGDIQDILKDETLTAVDKINALPPLVAELQRVSAYIKELGDGIQGD